MAAGHETEELLRIWERASDATAASRGTVLLDLVGGETNSETCLGDLDARLCEMRIARFGATADFVVACPKCGCTYDATLDLPELHRSSGAGRVVVTKAGCVVTARAPTVHDISAVEHLAASSQAETLFRRCLIEVRGPDGTLLKAADWPSGIRQAVAEALVDGGSDISAIDAACDGCGHVWTAGVDLVGLLWADVSVVACHLLEMVHRIANAYHWSESEILALPMARRRFYLDAIG